MHDGQKRKCSSLIVDHMRRDIAVVDQIFENGNVTQMNCLSSSGTTKMNSELFGAQNCFDQSTQLIIINNPTSGQTIFQSWFRHLC